MPLRDSSCLCDAVEDAHRLRVQPFLSAATPAAFAGPGGPAASVTFYRGTASVERLRG
jgi:hypothetical protein